MNMVYLLYCDASASQNRLAWAFVLKSSELEVEGSGPGCYGINQSELIAILQGLDRIAEPSEVIVFTDSVYVLRAARNSARIGSLAGQLRAHQLKHKIRFVKVGKGKGPCPDHTRAHHLAREIIFGEKR